MPKIPLAFTGGLHVAAVLVCSWLIVSGPMAMAQSSPQALLKAGISALKTGKHKTAIGQLSKALESGKLSDEQMARALYHRGKAYRISNQQGLAIADLTNAVFLNALPAKEQAALKLEQQSVFSGGAPQSKPVPVAPATPRVKAPSAPRVAVKPVTVPTKPTAPAETVQSQPSVVGSVSAPRGVTTQQNGQVVVQSPRVRPSAAGPSGAGAAARNSRIGSNVGAVPTVSSTGTVAPAPVAVSRPKPASSEEEFDPIQSVATFFESLIPGSQSSAPSANVAVSNGNGQPTGQVYAPGAETNRQGAQVQTPNIQGRAPQPISPTRVAGVQAEASRAASQVNSGKRPVWMADPSVTTPQAPPFVPLVIYDGSDQAKKKVAAVQPAAKQRVQVTKVTAKTTALPKPIKAPVTSPQIVGTVPSKSAKPKKVAAVRKQSPTKVETKKTSKSLYQLMVGAGRTQEQAGYVWKTLQKSHPTLLSGLTPNIRPRTRKGLGSYFIVGLGPFDDWEKTQMICASFKKQGLPCNVISH